MKLIYLINKLLTIESYNEFTKIIKKGRKIRRKYTNPSEYKQYRNYIIEEMEEIEQLIYSSCTKLLANFNIDFETYEESVEYWCKQFPKFALIPNSMVENFRLMMQVNPGNENVEIDDICKIFDYQIKNFPKFRVAASVENMDLEVVVIQTYLDDIVAEEFGMEFED